MNNPFDAIDTRLQNIENLILSLKYPVMSVQETDQLLTIDQAAKFLSLKKATVYSLVSRRAIPYNKKGKRLYFSQNELTEWIKSGRKQTISEIQSQEIVLFKKKQAKKGGQP